jgi:elongation factor Ts
MAVSAADVKKLRDETDAPMMECKAALEEANGDYERAKEILREKGKAAAGKKAGRATGAGVVAFALDGSKGAAVVVECETDFVSKNEGFVEATQALAAKLLAQGSVDAEAEAAEIVAKFRENVVVAQTHLLESNAPIATYVHFDNSKGTAIFWTGPEEAAEAVRKVAIHATAFPPLAVQKEDLSQEKLDAEFEIELQRALNEGKPENIAKNIAQGRVNKEFIRQVVLLEQPFYADPSKTVGQYLAESAKGVTIDGFKYLVIGQTA